MLALAADAQAGWITLLTIQACFADLADAGEAVLLEKLGCRAEEEAALGLAAGGHLGDRLDKPAAETGDLAQRALQRRPRDALTAVLLVHEQAGDPPAGRGGGSLSYSRLCMMPGSSPGLPNWHHPSAVPLSPKTSAACARPSRTRRSFAARFCAASVRDTSGW
jgi:hypothetical protein